MDAHKNSFSKKDKTTKRVYISETLKIGILLITLLVGIIALHKGITEPEFWAFLSLVISYLAHNTSSTSAN